MSAEIFEATNDEYHASEGISNSMLGDFLDDPILYWHLYVEKDWVKPPPTPEMEFGTSIHQILPPERLLDHVLCIPYEALNKDGHRKGADWKVFAEAHKGKILVKSGDELEPYEQIHLNAYYHPLARLLNNAEYCEVNVRWTDPNTGLLLRSRLDRLHIGRELIVDAKTTVARDAEAFAKVVAEHHYYRQAAFYQEAASQLTGDPAYAFLFCAIRKSRPYSVSYYEIDNTYLELGREEMNRGLAALAKCLESPDVRDWMPIAQREITVLSCPNWVLNRDKWRL